MDRSSRITSPAGRLVAVLAASAFAVLVAPSLSSGAVPYTTQNFGTPTVTDDPAPPSKLIEVTPATPPTAAGEGLYFRATLDRNKVYKITVDGEALSPFNLRIGRDNPSSCTSGCTWHAAPDGVETWRVQGVTNLELLFYRTVASSYRVRSLEIEDCTATCTTDSGLKNHVLHDTPELAGALTAGDRYKAAKLILGWVAPKITFARGGETGPMDSYTRSASELYYDFFDARFNRRPRGGVFCGGAADFYQKVLALFSIPSHSVLFGTPAPGDIRHVTVLVPVPDGHGGSEYRILDPTFNLDFAVNGSSEPISAPELFETWRAGLLNRIDYRQGSLAERRISFDRAPDGSYSSERCGARAGVSTACSLDDFLRGFEPFLRSNGVQTGKGAYPHLLGVHELIDAPPLVAPTDFRTMQATFKDAVLQRKKVYVALLPFAPFLNQPSSIAGTPAVGSQLTAKPGWTSRTAIDGISYQWSRCDGSGANCSAITGAQSQTYVPTTADRGDRLRVAITASNEHGTTTDSAAVTAGAVP